MRKEIIMWLYLILYGVACLLLLVIVFAFLNLNELVEYAESLKQSNKFLFKVESLFSNLKEAESGQRGFLITKSAEFFEPYIRAEDEKNKAIRDLDTLTAVKPEYATEIKQLIGLVEKRYTLMEKVSPLSWAVTLTHDTLIGVLQEEKVVMDSARHVVDYLKKSESRDLSKFEFLLDKVTVQTPKLLIYLSAFAGLLLVFTFFLIYRELKVRWQYQTYLERTIEELQLSNQELEQFAYVASHDLQEPLRKLRTFGDRLQKKYENVLDKEGKFMIERMQHSAQHMQTLIDDLLSFSRLISRGEEQPFVPVNLRRVLDGVLDEYSEAIRRQSALVRMPKALPTVLGRSTQLHQVFANLLSNSLKFARPGQIPVVDVRFQMVKGRNIPNSRTGDFDREFCAIEFADNGVGFDMVYKEKIFTIFQRLHNRGEYDGSGIGLSICKKIVERHDGYIDAWSEPGKGSAFLIYLPVYNESD